MTFWDWVGLIIVTIIVTEAVKSCVMMWKGYKGQ